MRMKPKLILAALLLAGLSAPPASAATLFDASIDATLTLTGIVPLDGGDAGDLTVTGASMLVLVDPFFDGDATADGTSMLSPDSFPFLVGTGLTSHTRAFGGTSGIGFASSVVSTDGLVLIDNASPTSFLLNFRLDYTAFASATATVDDPLLEGAFAGAFLTLGSSQQTDPFDPLVARQMIADTAAGEAGGTVTDTFFFSFEIAPESDGSLSLVTDVQGFAYSEVAAAPIPEPTSWAMMIVGFGMIGWLLRRRVRASEIVI